MSNNTLLGLNTTNSSIVPPTKQFIYRMPLIIGLPHSDLLNDENKYIGITLGISYSNFHTKPCKTDDDFISLLLSVRLKYYPIAVLE